jgi:hypothetical protein
LFFSFFFFFFLFLFLFVGASKVLLQPLGWKGKRCDAIRFSLLLRGISFFVFSPRNLHGQLFGKSG